MSIELDPTPVFTWAQWMIAALFPIAAIGIGVKFGGRIINWIGGLLSQAL